MVHKLNLVVLKLKYSGTYKVCSKQYSRVVRMLLDEVVSSTVQRCIDPVLMEPKVTKLNM